MSGTVVVGSSRITPRRETYYNQRMGRCKLNLFLTRVMLIVHVNHTFGIIHQVSNLAIKARKAGAESVV
jgi:hypothetical protein